MLDENGKVIFNEQEQAELDRIVQDRLARESKKYDGHDDFKAVVDELRSFGYEGTPSQIREAVKAQREAFQQQQELEALQKQADDNGITPALAKEIKELKDELKQSKKALDDILTEKQAKALESQQKQQQEENWNTQVKEFEAEFPGTDLNEVGKNEKFLEFIEGSGWSLKQAYKKFVKIYGEIETETISKVAGKQSRSTSSAKSESSTENYSGLTTEQRESLAEWNKKYPHLAMTAQEFKNK